jgi:serine/threonine protein kinase
VVAEYDHQADVWAFGVILYYIVTRKFPFEATNGKTID